MSRNENLDYSKAVERLQEKYPGFFSPPYSRHTLKLLRGAVKFEQSSPKEKRIMTKNFHRREKVYYAIRQALLGGPKSFTTLWKVVGGSRSTLSSCLKGLCEDEIVKRNTLTRNYELKALGWRKLEEVRTPSSAYCKRQFRNDRTLVTESCSAIFYPRTGFIRIDESKPNLEEAVAALLNPTYFSVRKSGTIKFEIEVCLKAKGTIEVTPTQREREIAEWRRNEASWKAQDEYDRKMSSINRKRRAYG